MLLDHGGGKADEDYAEHHKPFPEFGGALFLQPAGADAQRIGNVQAGTDSGGSIEGINDACQPGEKIVPGKLRRPQVLNTGIKDVHRHGHHLGDDDEGLQIPEILHIVQRKIPQRDHNQQIPEAIGNEKELVEGDPVIQCAVDHMAVFHRDKVLCEKIEKEIDNPAQQQFQMRKLGIVEL